MSGAWFQLSELHINSSDSAYLEAHVTDDSPFLQGHFPGRPVVPVDDAGPPVNLPLAQFQVQLPPPPNYEATLNAFMRIGHSLWALLFAYLGGLLTRRLYDTRHVSSRAT